MSSDSAGAPRLIRSVVPRPAATGMTPAAAARDHVAALQELWVARGQTTDLVERGAQPLRNGATMVTLAQEIDGIPVNQGDLHVLLHTDGSLAAVSGTLMAATTKPSFVSSPGEALGHALDQQYGASRPQLAISDAGDAGGWQKLDVAPTADVQVESARARRELVRVGDQFVEAWRIEVMGTSARDPQSDPDIPPPFYAREYLVSDKGGKILRNTDLIQNDAFVYRVYAETTGIRRPLDGALESFAPHPTGVPDGSAPALIPQNLVVMEAFNGPVDKWLPDNATTTSGNNAEAFADMDGTNGPSPSDIRPEVKSGRVLNYTYNHEIGPLDSPDQSKAAAVNAFFVVNWMHDWWYDSGFTEVTRNGQADNFGRGGTGGDPLLVLAQAGANIGNRNNANMATPADGARPRMRMYLWTAGTRTTLAGPSGELPSEAFNAGPRNFDLIGDLVAVSDATAPTDDGCQPYTSDVTGKIVLVTFSGVCGSAATVNNAKAAGAVGIILADPASDDPRSFAGSAAANIPGLAVGKTAGESLKTALAAGPVTVTLHSAVAGPERDGDLDNTVVSHEWGHYLHHRLAQCGSQQCGGMSEGWGDFNALMMMLREGDNRDGTYAIGPYALANGTTPNTAYFGIRRFPYSRDRTKNDLSFRHIGDENLLPGGGGGPGNSEVHNTGEIWATMMWEVLNVLADQHGVTVARRRMSDYIVAGLLLAPPEATFTEQRDAILASASALDTDDMILMAAAFAGRGMGSCAVSPPNSSPTNSGVVESGTLAGKFGLGGISLTDDGISCDHDGYLDPGESGTLHVTLANNGILAAENVTITATTTATGVRLGAPIKIAAMQPFTSSGLSIPVTVLQTAPRNVLVTINLHVTGTNTCDKNGVDASLTIRTGADDVPTSSATDRASTRLLVWGRTGDGATDLWGRTTDTSGNQSFLGKDAGFPSDTQFVSPPVQVSPTQPLVVNLVHAYSLEGDPTAFFDGGVIEISTDGGTSWQDVTAFGVNPGYNATLFVGSGNPIGGRKAFSGVSDGFPALRPLQLDFGTQFAGQTVQLRFRIGTDVTASFAGWIIDDITFHGILNTPFPILVAETATCTARKAPLGDSAVATTQGAPAVSLAALDRAVCILNEDLQ
ncbi:MAG TPA: M36 family metallopeptidase [Kofleriaceae bacterium]|nr:M36 family metallopeptidase [Kofleriaceae bacterium]